jgi:hypothetical protein
MAEPGDLLEDPSETSLRFVRTAGSTEGRALELEWRIPAGRRLVALPHRHPSVDEHFELAAGRGRYRVGRRKEVATAPHTFVVPRNTAHVHPANAGDDGLVVRQWIELDQPDPPLVQGVERYFETVFAFAQRGEVDRFGRIRNPLQDALTIWENLVPGTYLAYVPVPAQRAFLGSLARLARRRGLTPVHEPERSTG